MPLFDPLNAQSEEVLVALKVADLLAATSQWQELTEKGEYEARKKIFVGTDPKPANGTEFTVDELAELFCLATIQRVDGSHVVASTGIVADRPDETGEQEIRLRRYVREGEDERDVFLWFWDRVSAMVATLQAAVESHEAPRIRNITEPLGPFLGDEKTEGAQGSYVWSTINYQWGDNLETE